MPKTSLKDLKQPQKRHKHRLKTTLKESKLPAHRHPPRSPGQSKYEGIGSIKVVQSLTKGLNKGL